MSERDLLEGLNDSLSMDELLRVPESQGLAEQDARLARLRGEPGAQERSIQAPDLDREFERLPQYGGGRAERLPQQDGFSGKGSWYSQLPQYGWVDREDRPGSNALGVPDEKQGIALPSRATLGQWFDVTFPDGQTHRLQQTDVGPAKWTGKGIDISAAAAHEAGYSPKNFPTGGNFTWKPAAEGDLSYDTEDRTAVGLGGSRAYAPETTTVPDTGRRQMADQPRGILDFLTGGQQQQQQPGGLLGMLGDPETMAYLAMIAKGASPYSNLDPNSMLSNAHKIAMQRQLQLQRQQENAIDNRRADEALGLRRQEFGDAREERQARERDRIQLKRDTIEQQARDRKANAEALKVLGIPTAPSPDDTETSPGPQSSLPDAYTPPELSPTVATAMASAAPSTSTPQFTDLPTEETMGGAAGATGQTGQTGPNRDDQLRERVKNLTEAYQREGLKDSTRKLIADEIKATNDKIGVPEGKDPKEWKKLKTKSEFSKQERAGEQAVESNLVIDEINRASKLVTPGAPTTAIGKAARDIGIDTSPPTAGLIGEWAQYVGGTPARSLRENLSTISGHVTVESLQKMREASPSGGALGNISNFEDKLLGSLKGSLNQGLAPKELQYNLNRLRNYTHAIASGMQITPQNAQAVLSGASIKQEAIEAIGSGKNKAQVLQRLKEYGLDTRGLE